MDSVDYNLRKLDNGQLAAVTSNFQYILCLAGAGSGKTRVLATRIFYLVKRKEIPPSNILAVTFTKNSAKEMKRRIEKMGVDVRNLWCSTFHSACYRILREFLHIKLNVLAHGESEKIIEILLEKPKDKNFKLEYNDFLREYNWPGYLFFEEALKVISECKSRSISPRNLARKVSNERNEDVKAFYKILIPLYFRYQQYLNKMKVWDFLELVRNTLELLWKNKSIRKKYQNKFNHILVDEFQDVNYGQVRFLDLLVHKTNNNLFAVGDDWQSIYGWRGGDVSYTLGFKRKYQKFSPGKVKVITIPYNYRSDGNIVYSASKFVMKNKKQFRKKIKAFNKPKIKINLILVNGRENEFLFVRRTILRLSQNKKLSFMILGRTWMSLRFFLRNRKMIEKESCLNEKYRLFISTIHGAKGMEADIVFFIGLHMGRNAFPDTREAPDILRVVNPAKKNERLAEERRNFYVGITRAKKKLFLIAEKDNESIFVKELAKRFLKRLEFDKVFFDDKMFDFVIGLEGTV